MASVALLQRAAEHPRHAAPLTPEQALETALLGIMAQPVALERIAPLLQRIAAPLLQPTADVIESRVRGLTQRGLLAIAPGRCGLATARRTAAGMRHLRQLLRAPLPPRGATHHDLAFMLRACLLDLLAEADRTAVTEELRLDLRAALAVAEHAARHCRSASPFARHWLDRQAARLRDDLLWLDSLTELEGARPSTTPSPHPSPASR